ncbi:MAG: AraC family transcriptional regulator [Anaerolineales bacterium]|nr:AraC family transcriptional regulator [Anaerolineales bacterium]
MTDKAQTKLSASASSDLTRLVLRFAVEIGVNTEEILKSVGLAPRVLENAEKRVSVEQFNAILEEIALRAEDQDLGLHFGEAEYIRPGGHVLFSVMMNCPTVGSAIEKLSRYHGLMVDFVQLRLDRRDNYAYLSWEPVYADLEPIRHYSEAVLTMLTATLHSLTEGKVHPVEVRFSHPRPQDTTEHQRIFRCPLVFGQPKNELVIRQKSLSWPIFLANPALLETLDQFAQKSLDKLYSPDTWADKVTHMIGKTLLRGEKPGISSIAYDLAISTRHLQTKLKEEGTTYRKLVDQVRKEIAIDYLRRAETTICDVAFLLGFADQSAFNHAFKRWTGSSPGEYRRN